MLMGSLFLNKILLLKTIIYFGEPQFLNNFPGSKIANIMKPFRNISAQKFTIKLYSSCSGTFTLLTTNQDSEKIKKLRGPSVE